MDWEILGHYREGENKPANSEGKLGSTTTGDDLGFKTQKAAFQHNI